MKASIYTSNDMIYFNREPSAEDYKFIEGMPFGFGRKELETDAVNGCNIHGDLLALACLLTCEPFTKNIIELNIPVSNAFKSTFQKYFKKELVTPVGNVKQRVTTDSYRNALAFSGGVDSCAALSLLPENTVCFFLKRRNDKGLGTGRYSSEAAIASCSAVENLGYEVCIASSNTEYGRDPIGFVVDWSNAIPAILNADNFNIRSISFGMILESAYRLGSNRFSDLKDRKGYRTWFALFESCGLQIALPTAGLSEILTTKLVLIPPAINYSPQSCVRGRNQRPCGMCFKCFRKSLIEAALRGLDIESNFFDNYNNNEIKRKISKQHVHHEIVFSYSLFKIRNIHSRELVELKNRLSAVNKYGIDFLERWNPISLNLIPSYLMASVTDSICRSSKPMNTADIKRMFDWDVAEFLKDKDYLLPSDTLHQGSDG